MSTTFLSALGLSLALTLAFELAFSLICGIRNQRDLLLVLLVNIVTNPAVVLIYLLFPSVWVKIPLELAAIAVEAIYYSKYASGIRHPVVFSICANCFSFTLGTVVNLLLRGGL
jgi:hypothetical protein